MPPRGTFGCLVACWLNPWFLRGRQNCWNLSGQVDAERTLGDFGLHWHKVVAGQRVACLPCTQTSRGSGARGHWVREAGVRVRNIGCCVAKPLAPAGKAQLLYF